MSWRGLVRRLRLVGILTGGLILGKASGYGALR